MHGCLGVWVSGCLGVWVSGCLGVCGCVGVWAGGGSDPENPGSGWGGARVCVCVCVCVCACVCMCVFVLPGWVLVSGLCWWCLCGLCVCCVGSVLLARSRPVVRGQLARLGDSSEAQALWKGFSV